MDHTYRYGTALLVTALKEGGRMSMNGLHRATGMDGARILHALEPAIACGHVAITVAPTRTGVGRPTKYYEWAGDGQRKPTHSLRPCMCCRREFVSEGPHHRLCSACRNLNVSPYAI